MGTTNKKTSDLSLENELMAAVAAVLIGLVGLGWSADRLVWGAAAVAARLGVPPVVIGLTIIGFGTSAPELFISAEAAMLGNPGIAFGNAIGSNIANLGLVLGITAAIRTLSVSASLVRREFSLMMVALFITLAVLIDGDLGRWESVFLILAMFVMLAVLVRLSDPRAADEADAPATSMSAALLWTVVGLVLLVISARVFVWGASGIASALGVSDLVIGLTVVAVGTSLPEVAAGIASALRRQPALIMGNVLGSNIMNILAVVGVAGVIHPSAIETALLMRDYPVMVLLSLAVWWRVWHGGTLEPRHGVALLLGYVLYWIYLGFSPYGL